jgi:hypothetical protein
MSNMIVYSNIFSKEDQSYLPQTVTELPNKGIKWITSTYSTISSMKAACITLFSERYSQVKETKVICHQKKTFVSV